MGLHYTVHVYIVLQKKKTQLHITKVSKANLKSFVERTCFGLTVYHRADTPLGNVSTPPNLHVFRLCIKDVIKTQSTSQMLERAQ